MKQLFFKSNLLHIRTNEGEFEVSNPEVVHTSPLVQFHRKWNEGDEVEWPYCVELIVSTEGVSTKAVARLLPKEEFKPAQPTPNFPKGGTTFTESDYKEFEGKDLHIVTPEFPEPQEKGHDCEFFLVTDVSVYACECDPHHILIDNQEYVAINKITKANPVSAPSESQEEMWKEVVEWVRIWPNISTNEVIFHFQNKITLARKQ